MAEPIPTENPSNAEQDDDIAINNMSVDTQQCKDSAEPQQIESSNPSKQQNPEQKDDQIENNQSSNKENTNTLNIPQETQSLTPTPSYHGEYHKALIDTLTILLDDTFKKYLESPYSTWLPLFEKSMKNEANKILYFYPILLKELKQKIKQNYLNKFEQIEAAKHLSLLHNKITMTLYKDNDITPTGDEDEDDGNDDLIVYKNPKITVRDQQLMKINETFREEIAALDQKIAMAQYKKNEIIARIEEKKKTLFNE